MTKKLLILAGMLVATTLTIVSCSKNGQHSKVPHGGAAGANGEEITDQYLTAFANKMSNEDTTGSFEKMYDEYLHFSGETLQRLFEIKKNIDVNKIVDHGTGNADLLKHQVSTAADLKIDLNRKALEKYGRGINQFGGDTLDQLLKEVYADPKFDDLKSHAAAGSDSVLAQATTCPHYGYWLTSTTKSGWGSGRGYYGVYRMRNSNNNDCDYEFRFDGVWRYVRANSFDTYLMLVNPKWLGGFGDSFYKRNVVLSLYNVDWGILLGATRVHLWCGYYGNVRMGAVN